jgi:competence protein ComEA
VPGADDAGVRDLSRTQIAVYGAIAVAILFVGAKSIRGEASSGGFEETGASVASGPGVTVSGSAGDVVVDVTGAVRRPGVYRLPLGSRVDDAVTRAGGPTARAELEAINLAARLADGQQVVVPQNLPAGSGAGVASEDGPISLGTATVEQLEEIDGIGPVTAGDILEYRDEHGGLASVDQLDQVPGIGPATMSSLRERLQP